MRHCAAGTTSNPQPYPVLMDFLKRDALLRRIGDVNEAPVTVSLEEFFDGNDEGGSIWCNIRNAIPPSRVFEILKQLRDRDSVSDVVILVTQYDGGEEWPFADTVYVITAESEAEVVSWLGDDYVPDEHWLATTPEHFRTLNIPTGTHAIGMWWD